MKVKTTNLTSLTTLPGSGRDSSLVFKLSIDHEHTRNDKTSFQIPYQIPIYQPNLSTANFLNAMLTNLAKNTNDNITS